MTSSGMSAGRPSQRRETPAPDVRDIIGQSTEEARINFHIPKGKRQAFKIWCARNDTTITEELTAHIDRLLSSNPDR
jgi:hypothetical protein